MVHFKEKPTERERWPGGFTSSRVFRLSWCGCACVLVSSFSHGALPVHPTLGSGFYPQSLVAQATRVQSARGSGGINGVAPRVYSRQRADSTDEPRSGRDVAEIGHLGSAPVEKVPSQHAGPWSVMSNGASSSTGVSRAAGATTAVPAFAHPDFRSKLAASVRGGAAKPNDALETTRSKSKTGARSKSLVSSKNLHTSNTLSLPLRPSPGLSATASSSSGGTSPSVLSSSLGGGDGQQQQQQQQNAGAAGRDRPLTAKETC